MTVTRRVDAVGRALAPLLRFNYEWYSPQEVWINRNEEKLMGKPEVFTRNPDKNEIVANELEQHGLVLDAFLA
jgi:hypothetical protein